jgi:hypothetical protein
MERVLVAPPLGTLVGEPLRLVDELEPTTQVRPELLGPGD